MLHPRTLATLALSQPPAPGRPAHLSAASGLVARGDHFYVVADDELQLARFAHDGGDGTLLPLFPGELPIAAAERKARKPDLEALLHLPRGDGGVDAVLALGSGSTPRRSRAALLPLDRFGNAAAPARTIDLAPLHARLREAFPALNLEGALLQGDTLVLMQRASAVDPRNAAIRIDARALHAALRSGVFAAPEHVDVHDIALGDRDGIGWGITDAAALADGRLLVCAALEDAADTYADGPCAGSGLGLLAPDGRVLAFEPLAPRCKVEGICVLAQGPTLALRLVTDADDAARAALLLALEWTPG